MLIDGESRADATDDDDDGMVMWRNRRATLLAFIDYMLTPYRWNLSMSICYHMTRIELPNVHTITHHEPDNFIPRRQATKASRVQRQVKVTNTNPPTP